MTDKNTEDQATTEDAKRTVNELAILRNSLKTLREMKDVQCSDGNWNYDPYMHGMANGMIFAISLFDGKRPEYLEAPEQWLKDLPDTELKTVEVVAT
jgi:hypothetical protein